MSVYTKSIQETNNVTFENHQPVLLFKFAMYKMLFCRQIGFPIHFISEAHCCTFVIIEYITQM